MGHHGEHSCKVIWTFDKRFGRSCRLKIFLIWSSGGPFVQWSGTICAILVKRHYEKQICEIILNLDQRFRRRCLLKIFLIWSSGGPFVQRNEPFVQFCRGYLDEQFCEIILNLDQ